MALLNGLDKASDGSISPMQHLGKRKRTASPEEKAVTTSETASLDQNLKDAVQLIQEHDLSKVILQTPLSRWEKDGSAIKKPKLALEKDDNENIELRISSHAYQSLSDLMTDINQVRKSLDEAVSGTNHTTVYETSVIGQIDSLLRTLSTLRSTTASEPSPLPITANSDISSQHKGPMLPPNQVLSLRSQTEQGIRQLFSGLPSSTNSFDVDGRRLPNGFELTEALTVDSNNLQSKDIRRFGEVFAAHRNAKMLDMPRASRSIRGNVLNFVAPFENISVSNKGDYRHANLHTGLWLRYATSAKAKGESKDQLKESQQTSGALFKGAFSSFAPSSDNTQSALTDHERSQQWWRKHGRKSRINPIPIDTSELDDATQALPVDGVAENDYEDMIANFIPEDSLPKESEDLLEDVSDLIQTLSSYQSLRSLEIARGPSSASKPSKDEQSVYELLHNQLQLLVSALPPFAVAKLNGDQLEKLNISTHIIVTPPEFVGTAQVDDNTLRRSRATQAATSGASRTSGPPQNRASYSTPAAAYNAQARVYNNIPNPAYAARPPGLPVYNTPRASVPTPTAMYTQAQYRTNGPAIHTPSVQQFQRPVVNGYSSTNITAQTPASVYMQRPSQPGYQQRAQDNATYNRVDLPQKPMVNGDTSQHQRTQYGSISNTPSATPPAPAAQQRILTEVSKQQHSSTAPQPLEEIVHPISPVGS